MRRISNYQEERILEEKNPDHYWQEVADQFVWRKKWDTVRSGDFNDLSIKWFDGAELNITENCIDRHLEKNKDKTAVFWEPNNPDEAPLEISYQQLHDKVCQLSNVLKDKGITKGDRVVLYMGMVPELLYGVLACARIGAIHSVVFGGFSSGALAGRVQDCQAKLLLTCDGVYRGNKLVELKAISDQALENCPSIENVLVVKRCDNPVGMIDDRDHWLKDLMDSASPNCEPELMQAEDPLFILYTSGSTGKPKGLQHTTAGYMVWSAYTFNNVFGVEENDLYWCSADIGWITGHSYIAYGPLLNGVSQVMFEGIPTFPTPARFWEVIDKYKVTHFYTAPTAIRALECYGLEHVQKNDLSSLKVLGTVGEPINKEAWDWYYKNIGHERCPIVDTWWQTETGGIMISSLAGITKDKPTFATKPLPGIYPVLLDENGKEIDQTNAEGALCVKNPWPGMARTIWGNHSRYKETYFSAYQGYYFTGDGARRDEEGDYRITGRIDDLINVSGHLLSTAEVENLLNEHPKVIESAVVGYPHDIKGQAIYAYIISSDPADYKSHKLEIDKELNSHITKVLGPICRPEKIQLVEGLPKTRSGKIMRRILRKIASGDTSNLGDTSTLLNPEIVDVIKDGAL